MIIRLGSIQDIEKVILQAWYNTRGGGQGLTEQPHVLCQIHLDKFYPDKNHQVSHHKKKKPLTKSSETTLMGRNRPIQEQTL